MPKGTHDVFAIVVNFIAIGLFKMIYIIGATLAPKL
jgi:hypothetical protein